MIREANKKDCIKLAALSIEVWINTYSYDGISTETSEYVLSTFTKEYFQNILTQKKYRLLVFEEGPYLRGYSLINLESFYGDKSHGFEIEKLYVHTKFQKKGIGKKLLSEIIKRYGKKFWLYSWEKNESLNFYKNFGFKDIGEYIFSFGDSLIKNRLLTYKHALENNNLYLNSAIL